MSSPAISTIIWDLETTIAPNIMDNRILEFGYIKVDSNFSEIESDSFFINDEERLMLIDEASIKANGITRDMIYNGDSRGYATGITPKDACNRMFTILNGNRWMGHNLIGFDIPLMKKEFERQKVDIPSSSDVCDTLQLFRTLDIKTKIPNIASLGLQSLRERFGLPIDNAHRAIGDCRTLIRVLKNVFFQLEAQKTIVKFVK